MTEIPDSRKSTDTRLGAPGEAGLGAALRDFTDEAERLVVLSTGPEAVRRRARNRRSRRRTGAVALAGGAALAAGLVWGALPHTQGGHSPQTIAPERELVSAASLLPPPEPDGRLTPESLLAPSALPWNTTYHWRTVATDRTPDTPLPDSGHGQCRVRWFEDLGTTDVIARTYSGRNRATAQHRIAAFPGPSEASGATSTLSSRLRNCGWHKTRATQKTPSHGSEPSDLHEYVLTSGPDAPVRVSLVQSDNRVAVLAVSTAIAYDHAHPDSRTDACLDGSLGDNGTAPSHGVRAPQTPGHC